MEGSRRESTQQDSEERESGATRGPTDGRTRGSPGPAHRQHQPTTNRPSACPQATTTLSILQYNVNKSLNKAMAVLVRDVGIAQYAVIAIQEPWICPGLNTTHFPPECRRRSNTFLW